MANIINMFGNTMPMSAKSLDFLWTKQKVISNNIANVDTPGFKSKYVTFEDAFRSRLEAASHSGEKEAMPRAINNAGWVVHNTNDETARADGNNVQLDVEMMEMTRTALQYQYLLNSFNGDVQRYTTAIKGQ